MAKCKVISHRGANKEAPQNTIPAFRRSLEIGCDGFETDIHLTADGHPVICHNYTIDETSTGNGEIRTKTLEELRTYDFGSYFDEKFEGTQLPLLDEFLELSKDEQVEIMNIEIKPPLDGNLEIVKKTIDAVKAKGLFGKLLISSFSPEVLVECKKIDPNCKTGFLYAPNKAFFYKTMLFGYVKFAKSIKADYLHPHFFTVTKTYVKKLHKNGIKVNVWTVNKPEIAEKLIKFGVDGLITDLPAMANELVEKYSV